MMVLTITYHNLDDHMIEVQNQDLFFSVCFEAAIFI